MVICLPLQPHLWSRPIHHLSDSGRVCRKILLKWNGQTITLKGRQGRRYHRHVIASQQRRCCYKKNAKTRKNPMEQKFFPTFSWRLHQAENLTSVGNNNNTFGIYFLAGYLNLCLWFCGGWVWLCVSASPSICVIVNFVADCRRDHSDIERVNYFSQMANDKKCTSFIHITSGPTQGSAR